MTILFAILLFSLLIFVHELGHFLAAKASGVQVNEFAMFMGPAIFKKQVGETLYSIRCIPIGGYCAMEGEDQASDNPRAFGSAKWWKRLIILLAGSAMNFVTGVLIMVLVFAPMTKYITPVIDQFDEGSLVYGEDKLQVGDEFVRIDGEKIYNQGDVTMILALNPGDVHDIVVRRNGQLVELNDFRMEKKIFGNEETPRYGFSFSIEDATFASNLKYSWSMVLNSLRNVRLSLQMLFSGRASINDVSGPVGIIGQMNQTAQSSDSAWSAFMNMLYFGGFLALNLAVMNLLPIPALDGGRAVCLLLTAGVEAIIGKKINPKYEGYLHGAGMVILLGFMALIMFKDIFSIFKG